MIPFMLARDEDVRQIERQNCSKEALRVPSTVKEEVPSTRSGMYNNHMTETRARLRYQPRQLRNATVPSSPEAVYVG